jgi:hypothetical protein
MDPEELERKDYDCGDFGQECMKSGHAQAKESSKIYEMIRLELLLGRRISILSIYSRSICGVDGRR